MNLIKVSISAILCLQVGYSFALSLGATAESSKLGAALDLRIPIEAGNLNENQLIVNIASIDIHTKQGVDYSSIPNDLALTVDTDSNGIYAQVSTRKPINQPFVEFILKLQSPTGTLFKRYQIFMDP